MASHLHHLNVDGRERPDQRVVYCRVCLDSGYQNSMIAPCMCSGSIRYVHRECLDRWRAQGLATRNMTECPVCKFKYILRHRNSRQSNSLSRILLARFVWWMVLAAAAVLLGGFVAKGMLCYGGFSEFYCTQWLPPRFLDVGRVMTQQQWVGDHAYLGSMAALAMVGLYALVKGFILWATGAQVTDDPVRMHGADEMPGDDPQHPQHPHQAPQGDNAPGRNNNDYNDVEMNRRDSRWYHDFPVFINFGGRGGGGSGGGGGGSGGSTSGSKCNSKDDTCKFLVVVLVIVGVLFLLYVMGVSIYKTVQAEKRRMRENMVKELEVVDLEQDAGGD